MSSPQLNPAALQESARTLAAALGIAHSSATKLLDKNISIISENSNAAAVRIADELELLLARTFKQVHRNYSSSADLCIAVGRIPLSGRNRALHVSWDLNSISITSEAKYGTCPSGQHQLFLMVGACYAAALATKALTGIQQTQQSLAPFTVNLHELGVERGWLDCPLLLSDTYMAGAGAIGNGLVHALQHLDVSGRMHIADSDLVDETNIQRQVCFTNNDIGKPKATTLVERAQKSLPKLLLIPHDCRLQDLRPSTNDHWLQRLIICVDSRRARRELQNEMPGEVFDASTTDIREIVLHHHRQPTSAACISCIYTTDKRELQHDEILASSLGVTIDEVRKPEIDIRAAERITTYLKLDKEPKDIVGLAYDTLYKQLCGQDLLTEASGRQLLSPFSFVSVLAGALLAFELVRKLTNPMITNDNYWRVSPWLPPDGTLRRHRRKISKCQFCGNSRLQSINTRLWANNR